MANELLKREGVRNDSLVFYISPRWYLVPFTAMVTLDSVIGRYGLVPSVDSMVDNKIISTAPATITSVEEAEDRVIEMQQRWANMLSDPIADVKELIQRNQVEWNAFLPSYILP